MSTKRLQQILDLSPERAGPELLDQPEDQWFDRKSPRIAARDLAEAAIGFANAEGGVIVIGLWNGRVIGVDGAGTKAENAWRQATFDFVVPPLRSSYHRLECVTEDGERDHLVVLSVEASPQVHASVRDDVFLRVGDENRRLAFSQRQELLYEKGQASFEAGPVAGSSVEEVDADLLDEYARSVGHGESERLLRARGLADAVGVLTTAGALLFSRNPQKWFPEAYVRVLRFRGAERGTGSRQELLEDVRCEGPLPHQIVAGREAVTRLLPARRVLGADGRFESVGLVPSDAWLEGLVNAVIHRSYSVAGDHVRVEIFDDRVEIVSPGRFPGLVRIGDPKSITRFARNPRIARVCSDLRFGQELGEGIRRIYEEMRLAGLTEPRYHQTAGSVRLVLSAEAALDGAAELPEGTRALLRTLRATGPASTGELMAETGVSRPTLIGRLRALEEAGLVEWVGQSKRDPRAFWRLNGD